MWKNMKLRSKVQSLFSRPSVCARKFVFPVLVARGHDLDAEGELRCMRCGYNKLHESDVITGEDLSGCERCMHRGCQEELVGVKWNWWWKPVMFSTWIGDIVWIKIRRRNRDV